MPEAARSDTGEREEPVYFYRAYGLDIRSCVQLPELPELGAGTDVTIRFASGGADPESGAIVLSYPGLGRIEIRDGREIVLDVASRDDEFVRFMVSGAALGLLLYQRGFLVLHASAVELAGQAIAFLGDRGSGKSTTAAAFHARGHSVVADDVLAVDLGTDPPTVQPAFPQLRLWPEAVTWLGGTVESLPRIRPEFDKRAHRVEDAFTAASRPLGHLYVLEEDREFSIRSMTGPDATVALVRNSYAWEHLQPGDRANHNLVQCAELANRGAIKRLARPRDLAFLEKLVRLIEADVGGLVKES